MNLSEIIKDALAYPTMHITALLIYLVLGFLVGLVLVLTGTGGFVSGAFNFEAGIIVGIIGIIIVICLYLLMLGFSLDVIKLGIDRSANAPVIDFTKQVSNGFKYIIVSIVYFIIPTIITAILGIILQNWIAIAIGVIFFIIFAFALAMAECRLAETDDLGYALNIMGSFADMSEIGVGKVIITLIVSSLLGTILIFILNIIISIILVSINIQSFTSTIIPIYSSVVDAWLLFYLNRVMGLLYSTK